MEMRSKKSQMIREIEALSKGVSVSGKVFEESEDHLAIQVGKNLLEIPLDQISKISELGNEAGNRYVAVDLIADAKIIQKAVISASDLAAYIGIFDVGGQTECHMQRCPMCIPPEGFGSLGTGMGFRKLTGMR